MQVSQDHYWNYVEVTEFLKSVEAAHPNFAKLESIGQTREGRDIWLISLTSFETGLPETKPAIWLDANTHAGEVTGTQACLAFIGNMLNGIKDKSAETLQILKTTTYYCVPRISADGAELYIATGHFLRSTPLPWPQYGGTDRWQQKDLDGNNEILTIRKEDPGGAFKISKKNPKLMIQREAVDADGSDTFYSLYEEGDFTTQSSAVQKMEALWGYDLNRNFPFEFRSEGEQKGAGDHAMCLAETEAIVKAVSSRKNIFLVISLHTSGGFWLRPWSSRPDSEMNSQDLAVYKSIGDWAAKESDYAHLNVFRDFQYVEGQITSGHFDDWCYGQLGIHAYVVEIWDVFAKVGVNFAHPTDRYFKIGEEPLLKLYSWCQENLEHSEFYQDWTPYQHPQLGKVEIGGWKFKYLMQNPPKKYLGEETQKLANVFLQLAHSAPQLKHEVQIEKVGSQASLVKLRIKNVGFFSTSGSELSKKVNADHRPFYELKLNDRQTLLSGKKTGEVNHLEGRSRFLPWHTPHGFYMRDNTHELEIEFLIEGSGQVEFCGNFFRAGKIHLVWQI